MSVLLANRPSPRPSFTYVAEARARKQGPVVVVVSDAQGGVTALPRAAEEAAMHSVRLYVMDASAGGFKEHLLKEHESAANRGCSVALSILRNPNVTTSHIDGADFSELDRFCHKVGASLLVLDWDCLSRFSELGRTIGCELKEPDLACDVLIVRKRSGFPR